MSDHREFHEHLKMRVPAVQEAIKRTRFAFMLCTLASFASIICLWNAYLSRYRFLAEKPLIAASTAAADSSLPPECFIKARQYRHLGDKDKAPDKACLDYYMTAESNRIHELRVDTYKSWIDSQSININLLGIRIGVSDFAAMDSLAMYIFLYYALLTIRRENREVAVLLRDVSNNLDYMGYAAYSAINSYMVFNLNLGDDSAISTLEDKTEPTQKNPILRAVVKVLIWAPATTIGLIILCDAFTLRAEWYVPFASLFRDNSIAADLSQPEMVEIWLIEIFAFLMLGLAILATIQVRRYGDATRSVLDKFSKLLHQEGFLSKALAEP